jgi:hypothetical protein
MSTQPGGDLPVEPEDTRRLEALAESEPLPAPSPAGRRQQSVRVGTVVWGLVVAVGGVLALVVAGGADVDGGAVAIGILGGAGLALVVGSLASGLRRRDRT